MAKVTTAGISDVVEEQLLNAGTYKIQCYNAEIYENKKNPADIKSKLLLNHVVLDGDEQRDGSSPDERKFSDFISYDHYMEMNDQGKYAKQRLKNALNVFEVEHEDDEWDPNDFMEKIVMVKLKEGVNKNTNEPTTSVSKYMPAPEEDF